MKQILVIIDRFEGEYAVLRHKDHEILLPKEDLPEGVSEGGAITLSIMSQKQAEQDRSQLAKELINDILNDALGEGLDTRPEAERFREREMELLEKEADSLEKSTKKIGDENKKLDDLNKKMDDLDKKYKGR